MLSAMYDKTSVSKKYYLTRALAHWSVGVLQRFWVWLATDLYYWRSQCMASKSKLSTAYH